MLHHQRLTSLGTTNGSPDAAKGLQEELGIKQTAPPVLPGTTALLWHKATSALLVDTKDASRHKALPPPPSSTTKGSSGALKTINDCSGSKGAEELGTPTTDASRTANAKSFAKHKARNGSSRAAPQRDPLRPSAQGLLKCCTINGSPPWHHQRLLRCSKGAPRRAGHKQTAPPVLLGKHCSAGVAQSNLRSWRQDTILRRGGHQGRLQDGKNAKSFAKHKARNGSSRAAPQRDPLRPSAQGLLKCCTINGSPAVAPPTAPPMQQRGSKKSWASNKLLLRCSLVTTALLGRYKAILWSRCQHTLLQRGDTRMPPGRQTPRALPSTKQEMAPPERHHKGILCGRALRGSSNAAPSTAHHLQVAPPTAPPMQQRGSKKS